MGIERAGGVNKVAVWIALIPPIILLIIVVLGIFAALIIPQVLQYKTRTSCAGAYSDAKQIIATAKVELGKNPQLVFTNIKELAQYGFQKTNEDNIIHFENLNAYGGWISVTHTRCNKIYYVQASGKIAESLKNNKNAFVPAPVPVPVSATDLAMNLYNKAATLCASGVCSDTQKAMEYLNEAIRLQPDFTNAYGLRGNAYNDLKQYQLAIQNYDEAIRLKPDEAVFFINRGNTYFSQGNNELGCRDVQKACELKNCEALNSAKKGMKCVSKGNNIKLTHANKILPAQSKDISTSIEGCAKYARAMVDNSNKTEWKAYADKIKSICPGKGFECKTYYNHPEKNKCEPFILEDERTFFKDVRYDFPRNN
jgi:tetratricopeptide (TPR) repeat protein